MFMQFHRDRSGAADHGEAFGADPVCMNVALTSYLLSLAVFLFRRVGGGPLALAPCSVSARFCVGVPIRCGFWWYLQGIGGAMMVALVLKQNWWRRWRG